MLIKKNTFVVCKNWITDWVTQFHQPIFINSRPNQNSERSELNRPNKTGLDLSLFGGRLKRSRIT